MRKIAKKAIFVVLFLMMQQGLFGIANKGQTENSTDKQVILEADDFSIINGFEVISARWEQRRFLQLKKPAKEGQIDAIFGGQTAKYDITVSFVGYDGFSEKCEIDVLVNGEKTAGGTLAMPEGSDKDSKNAVDKTIGTVNIQQYSKISFKIAGSSEKSCRIEKVIFTAKGAFDGKKKDIKKPAELMVYEDTKEKQAASNMLNEYIGQNLKPLIDGRKAELASLKTPEQWKEKQAKIRARLSEYLGEFPERTPLNAKIVGKIDRNDVVIEKLIFESEPNYYCTANVYVPKGRKFPLPGILFTCGHINEGKGTEYHECGVGLASKGYVVLVFDPIGEGERSEYFDEKTGEPTVERTVSQHHYIGRPSILVGWSLLSQRVWDAIRAIDYLASRPEVDANKLGVTGNSGGGQMTLMIAAVDERIKVCAADHPGGSCEHSYLDGDADKDNDKDIFGLIAPRPCRIIVGDKSGEEAGHRKKLEDMQVFYNGLGASKDRSDLVLVEGYHDMKRPKREAAYEWFNKWFDKESEGKTEAPFKIEDANNLWCTKSGLTLMSLGGESAQTLNAKRAEKIYKPEKDIEKLKERVVIRIGLNVVQANVSWESKGSYDANSFTAEKLLYKSEEGIEVPTLLFKPKVKDVKNCVVINVCEKGKPTKENGSIATALAKDGFTVLSIDVRGIGETDPTPLASYKQLNQYTGYDSFQYYRDKLAIRCISFKQTLTGMRAMDVIRVIDFVKQRNDLKDKRLVLIGEDAGGLWAMLAAAYDKRVQSVVCVGTLPSYKLITGSKYYNVWNYFWVPNVLSDFDIPDLSRLIEPRAQIWINPVDALGQKLDVNRASAIIGVHKKLSIIRTDKDINHVIEAFIVKQMKS